MSENMNILDKIESEEGTSRSEDGSVVVQIPDSIKVVPGRTKRHLDSENLRHYRSHRKRFLRWCLREGKCPEDKKGYSEATMKPHAYRTDRFYRYVWEKEGEYTTKITKEHAEDYVDLLAEVDEGRAHKAQCVKALKILYKWRKHTQGEESLNMKNPFSSGGRKNPNDYLTTKERKKVREAAYEYGRIPTEDKSQVEINALKTHLSQRFGIKKEDVCIEDLRSWKVPSLVEVSLDVGMRPCEVERATTDWVDLENNRLLIPHKESSKNQNNWEPVLKESTTEVLEKWLEEREEKDIYQDTDALWLTRRENPYNKNSLRDLLHKLFEVADISKEGRQVSWYTIRHSTGTYLSEEKGLEHASAQLRHNSQDTTKAYIHPPAEKRREGVESLG